MRIFLGGVPFGCDNIGDEAILAGIVAILRKNLDSPQITVASAKPFETEKLLGVRSVPLYGFSKEYPAEALRKEFANQDLFIWSGATGLSDYPQVTLKLLRVARQCGLKTAIWGVGMDNFLNPAFFKLGGKKLLLAKLLTALTFGSVDFIKVGENLLSGKQKKRIAAELLKTDLIAVRDYQTQALLKSCDKNLKANVGADSALIFTSPDSSKLSCLDEKTREELLGEGEKIGLCISAQRAVGDMGALAAAFDELLDCENRKLFLIPMNPKTDSVLMESLKSRMRNAQKVFLLKNCEEPEEVLAAAEQCGVVVSSRLHLLILSANAGTPIVGISRGSKVDNFLNNFDLKSAGSVYQPDCAELKRQVEFQLKTPAPFLAARARAYADFAEREARAEILLKKLSTK